MTIRTVGVNLTPLSHLGAFDAQWLKAVAQQVERLGFDTLWCGDHIIMHNAISDAMTVLATFGAVTERVKIGTGVLLIPLRYPVAIAKQVTSLDLLTQGRFQFGVGVGGEIPHEFAAVNIRVHERGRRTDEGLEIITRVLSQEKVSYAGKHYQIEDVTLLPRPQQLPYPPIWVGGRSEAALRRAARFGSGWMGYMNNPQQAQDARQRLDDFALEFGRNPSEIQVSELLMIAIAKDYETARNMAIDELSCRYNQPFDQIVDRYCLLGTPEQCVESLLPYLEAGVDRVELSFCCTNDQLSDQLEQTAAEILPHLDGA